MPNSALRRRVGFSNHPSIATNAAPSIAVSAMSVVPRPACASTAGRKLNSPTDTTAVGVPKNRRAQK